MKIKTYSYENTIEMACGLLCPTIVFGAIFLICRLYLASDVVDFFTVFYNMSGFVGVLSFILAMGCFVRAFALKKGNN